MLENVRPHGSRKELVIENYGGRRMAEWMGDSRLSNLVPISQSNCIECKVLSPLSRFLFLRRLFMQGFGKLKRVGDEFCREESDGKSDLTPFSSLKNLEFYGTYVWEEWKIIEGAFTHLLAYADSTGGYPSPLNYHFFPKSCCTSVNEVSEFLMLGN